MQTGLRSAAVAASAIIATSGMGVAAELSPATGQIVLTVAGKIENTNRAAFDAFLDPFINYHERKFDKAAEFDLAMLEGLGMHEIDVAYEAWPGPIRLAGPLLSDVLGAIGAQPEGLTALALDGFAVELTKEQLEQETWIVAIKLDGEYMGIGQRGPAWLVFDPGDDNSVTAEEEGSWPWAAFYFEVK
ncbi:MAG: hypothetical protein HC871_15245 [Rhizobiales bacterium]|nr:hypothetical protein [Hyphomicrobiales bacterium]